LRGVSNHEARRVMVSRDWPYAIALPQAGRRGAPLVPRHC